MAGKDSQSSALMRPLRPLLSISPQDKSVWKAGTKTLVLGNRMDWDGSAQMLQGKLPLGARGTGTVGNGVGPTVGASVWPARTQPQLLFTLDTALAQSTGDKPPLSPSDWTAEQRIVASAPNVSSVTVTVANSNEMRTEGLARLHTLHDGKPVSGLVV